MNLASKTTTWKSLENHAAEIRSKLNSGAVSKAKPISTCNITLDYSNQSIPPNALSLLTQLAENCHLHEKIKALISGAIVNHSEHRPALHTALRADEQTVITVENKNIMPEVVNTRFEIKRISELIRNKLWLGFSGKPIKDIVNIGIGGSDLGPRFCIQALRDYITPELGYHFIPDVDPNGFEHTVRDLNPETTLFIVSSKSFTTPETLYNGRKALAWIGTRTNLQQHFIAVTANRQKAFEFGIKNVLPIWDWVGGRYSFCSAINLISAIALGYPHFSAILQGAQAMDEHFLTADFHENLPALLGLIGVWNNNFFSIHTHLILTYAAQLEKLVPYIQQLDMESNGKSIDNQGNPVHYATGPIVWGGLGNQAQHSYYQLLCQGTHKTTVDFITLKPFEQELINNMAAAKMNILSQGVNNQENPVEFIPGGVPLNHIQLNDCTPYTIGALVALYEHKIFTQSVIWDINPFDQPGVESAKKHSRLKTLLTEFS
ncbi:glucose-6-phosphate isomerase [Legionella impletisoli]|uniref:Glucose-6-phosphate isomerase n=1 Tax=Legionella impletisoli TaxID=343510 RepID=A0A917N9A6_9GAMM|nr:glucose-6-phosphate isomerase [Legionella impletisoli]GGI80159.1 glucose-6-phosphate isomerase [Legionella impletisoli]